MVYDQCEPAWPAHGSVLNRDGQVRRTAERSPCSNGGIHCVRLDPASGLLISEALISTLNRKAGWQAPVGLRREPFAFPAQG